MMRSVGCILVLFLGTSCAEKESAVFLQAKQLPLATPQVEMSSAIIDSTVLITAAFGMDGAQLFYTTDGSEPTDRAFQYTEPLEVSEAGLYAFRAFHSDWKPSETAFAKAYIKGFQPLKIVWRSQPNEKYPSIGKNSLVNNQKGTLNFLDSQWMGYDTAAVATVYFEKEVEIKKITIGYLVDTNSWIFPPKSVSIRFDDAHSISIEVPAVTTETKELRSIEIPVDRKADQYTITIENIKELPEWHAGAGAKGWLFMDEWMFN